MKIKAEYTRKFLGELFPSRKDANYEKAHLKGYLKGHELFGFGKHLDGKQVYHKVKQEVTEINKEV